MGGRGGLLPSTGVRTPKCFVKTYFIQNEMSNKKYLKQCQEPECNEMIIEGPYCFRHAKRKAVIGGYLKRNMDSDHTIRDEPILDIDKTNTEDASVD